MRARRWRLSGAVQRLVLVVAVGCALAPASAMASDSRPRDVVVRTDKGPVRGTESDQMRRFLGIPYAAAPVGDLRWKPPQEHPRWNGVLDAAQFRPHCAQPPSPYGEASANEDCLFLNVFTPARKDDGRDDLSWDGGRHGSPVMFWIHGGGLTVGESEDYDPSKLVGQGVVVVTINYRLGQLGFLAHPALAAESPRGASGNYGLMDQQAALRWVRRNIQAFGGDPGDVTIFGESAGGLSVHSQLVSPLASHLFNGAIAESGAYSLDQPSLPTAEAAGQAFAARAGCPDQSAACLRSLPVSTILANQGTGTVVPTVDGFVLPQTVRAAFSSGTFNRVPVIEGSNRDEWRLFVAQAEATTGVPLTEAGYIPAIAATLGVSPARAAAIAAAYPLSNYPSPSVALGAAGTDAIFACNTQTVVDLLSRYVRTYQYEFNDPNAPMLFFPPVSFPTGAYHAAELQYLFNLTRTPVPNPGLTPQQQQLSRAMVRYWTQFARNGDPNGPGVPYWPRYSSTRQQFQMLVPPTPRTATGFAAEHNCSFWAAR